MLKYYFVLISLIIVCHCNAQDYGEAQNFANGITESTLREKLSIVASAEMEGRETATSGQRRAAAYIEAQFKQLGLLPANDTSYQQYFPVYKERFDTCSIAINGKSFEWNKDFYFDFRESSPIDTITSNIVYVSYGIIDPKNKLDDYGTIDVKGKIVIALNGAPNGYQQDSNNFQYLLPNSIDGKVATAQSKGAIGFLLVTNSYPDKMSSAYEGKMYIRKSTYYDASNHFVKGAISQNMALAMLGKQMESANNSFNYATGIYSTHLQIKIAKRIDTIYSSNVGGILEGTDKKDEFLVLSAHYDHIGKQGEIINYGADDDGSGTVSVMEMARTFAEAKKNGKGPRRSILFLTFSGEEKGLWGSEYYSEHPLVPLEKTTADLNTDMIGRVGSAFKGDTSNYVYVIGDDKISSDLIKITNSLNKHAHLILDRRYNDLKDPNMFYYRSDHYNFARKGVPIIFYFDGVHADYHKPTDTVDKINFALMKKRVHFIFQTAWAIANKDAMLKRDKALKLPKRGR